MNDENSFKVPSGSSESKLTDRGSKFIAFCCPASSVEEALSVIAARSRQYHDASHHCWAMRIGDPASVIERSSDAGEPAGTAGKPILDRLRGAKLFDVVVIVTRWFGGTRLGKGGLIRAYGGCTAGAVETLPVVSRIPVRKLEINCEYALIGLVEKLAKLCEGRMLRGDYGSDVVLAVEIPEARCDEFIRRIVDESSGKVEVRELPSRVQTSADNPPVPD